MGLFSQVRDAAVGLWRTLDAPWLSKLGGLGTLIWIGPILFGALRALTTLDALTVAVLAVGVVGLVVQALRHRARPQPGFIEVGEPRLTGVVTRGPVREEPASRTDGPQLRADPPDDKNTYAFMRESNGESKMAAWHRIGIPIYNDPESGALAEDVSAVIEVYDEQGNRVALSHGNWRGEPEPEVRDIQNPEPQRVTLRADGHRRTLDVVVRDAYEPIASTTAYLATPHLRGSPVIGGALVPGRYRVAVSLTGPNLGGTVRFSYALENPSGEQDRMKLRPLDVERNLQAPRGIRPSRRSEQVIAASDPDDDFVIEVVEEDWEIWDFHACIVFIRAKVTNTTTKPRKIKSVGVAPAYLGAVPELIVAIGDRSSQRRERFGPSVPQRAVNPDETVTVWSVAPLPRPKGGPGYPGYELGVTDDFDRDYVAVRSPEGRRVYILGSRIVQEKEKGEGQP